MKLFLPALFILISGLTAAAQQAPRLEALKIAYITRKLDLSPEEAQRFWPVYNQYSAELRQTRQRAMQNNITVIDQEEQELNIHKKYNGQFSQAIPAEKVNNFYKAEKEFAQFVQKEMERRQLRQQRRNMNP